MVRNAYRTKVETCELEIKRLQDALIERNQQVLALEGKVELLEKENLTYRQRMNNLSQENEAFQQRVKALANENLKLIELKKNIVNSISRFPETRDSLRSENALRDLSSDMLRQPLTSTLAVNRSASVRWESRKSQLLKFV